MGSELRNLGRVLTWAEYNRVQRAAPGPDEVAMGAETLIGIQRPSVTFDPVAGSRPTVYRLRDSLVTTIVFDRRSWVATWVFAQSRAFQDALLNHEQGHYRITALSGRDFHNELLALRSTDYASTADGRAAVQEIVDRYTPGEIQAIHDKYDAEDQVNHQPLANATAQARWDAALGRAVQFGRPLRTVLAADNLAP